MATISTLSAGTQIAITEASYPAYYTLVHHNYNSGKAMLLRNASVGTSAWRTPASSTTSGNIFQGSTLDNYLINWYNTLPASTTQYLTSLDYPVTTSNQNGSKTYITRNACTVSAAETPLADHANWQDIGDLEFVRLQLGETWWTRQPSAGTSTYAYSINSDGAAYSTVYTTYVRNVRPTLGVSENQNMVYDDDLEAYVFTSNSTSTTPDAPATLYLDGALQDYTEVIPDPEQTSLRYTLSWTSVANAAYYQVGYIDVDLSTSTATNYTGYGIVTGLSKAVAPPSGYNMRRMFFVRSISSDGAISSWSTGTRYLRTKTSASGGTALAAPTNLCLNGDPYSYAGATPGTEYTLSWDPVSGAYGYSIYYSTDRSSWSWAKDVTTTSTTVTASENYSTYRYFAVKAMSQSGNEDSALSTQIISVSTTASPEDKCTTPEYFYLNGLSGEIANVTPGTPLTLSWSASAGRVKEYAVYYTDTGDYPFTAVGTTTTQSMLVYAPDTPLTTRHFTVAVKSEVVGGDTYPSTSKGVKATTSSGGATEPDIPDNPGAYYFNGFSWQSISPLCYTSSGWVNPIVRQYINGGWTKIWPPESNNSYTVEAISGAQYGFTLNSSGYFQSDNKGVHGSYAICKVKIVADGSSAVYVDCINYAESNFDYGILSNINTTLTLSSSADTTNVKQSFKGMQSASVQTVNYGVLPAGEHYIYVKFIKDGSESSNNDTLQFKIRFVNSSSLECSYSVASVSGASYDFSLNIFGYYQSNNKGIGDSYAICKVNIVSDGIKSTYFDCINYGENGWDYGMLSQVNTTLALNNTADSTVQQSFKTSSSTSIQTVNYGVLPAGEHYVYVKYIKDGSVDSGNDTLQFKVRFA